MHNDTIGSVYSLKEEPYENEAHKMNVNMPLYSTAPKMEGSGQVHIEETNRMPQ